MSSHHHTPDCQSHNPRDLDQRSQNLVRIAGRFGYITKGIFYIILGALALRAAVQAGSAHLRLHTVLLDILNQPFGQFILGLMIFGMLGYAFWRLVQSVFDLDQKGKDMSGMIQRVSYLFSAAGYSAIAYSSIRLLLGETSSQASISIKKLIEIVYHHPLGPALVGLVGLVLLGVSFFQFFRSASARFRRHMDWANIRPIVQGIILVLGRTGFAARGVLYLLIGLSLVAAAVTYTPSMAGGYGTAFQTLDSMQQVPWILGIVAFGLILYGFYAVLVARYRCFTTS